MKFAFVIFSITVLAGCAGQTGTLPMLDGTQRVPINKQIPVMNTPNAKPQPTGE